MTELTLDCETLVNELEGDSENQGSIYLFGVSETFKEQLLQEPRLFLGLEAVILPKDLKNGKQKKYCFLSKSMLSNVALGKETGDGNNMRSEKGRFTSWAGPGQQFLILSSSYGPGQAAWMGSTFSALNNKVGVLAFRIQKFWQCPAGPQHSHRQGLEAERQACSNPQAPPCLAQRLTT